MSFLIFAAVAFIAVLALPKVEPFQEDRIDDNINYLPYQDIVQAFNITPQFYWLYGTKYENQVSFNSSCIYFDIKQLSQEGMNYSINYMKNDTWKTIEYIGTFNKTPAEHDQVQVARNHSNVLVSVPKTGGDTKTYKLIASYKNSSVLGVLNGTKRDGCLVLLTDSVARDHTQNLLTYLYRHACANIDRKPIKVFKDNCRRPEVPAC